VCKADNLTPSHAHRKEILEASTSLNAKGLSRIVYGLGVPLLCLKHCFFRCLEFHSVVCCIVPLDKSGSKRASGRKAVDNHIPCKDDKIGTVYPFNQLDVTWLTPGTFYTAG
jgi:hypothetical protein